MAHPRSSPLDARGGGASVSAAFGKAVDAATVACRCRSRLRFGEAFFAQLLVELSVSAVASAAVSAENSRRR
eukprot:4028750-Pyramimonas_sp.AAC.1